jgi:hypothetical protein
MTRAIGLLVLLLLAGCTHAPKSITDVPAEQTPWLSQIRLTAHHDTLTVDITHDEHDLFIADLAPQAYDGELYLASVRLSKPAEPRRFVINTARFPLRQPWQEHVYWRTGGWYENGISALFTYRGPLTEHVRRTKMPVEVAP